MLDFFDLSATIFNSRTLTADQSIDKATALDLLTRAHSKHRYVVDTIEKAKEQSKGSLDLPEFTKEEIVEQMIKLAEVDIAKEKKQKKRAEKKAKAGKEEVAKKDMVRL